MSRVSDPVVVASWEQRLHEFSQSNLPVAAFCRQAGVSVATFYYWKRKLAPRSEGSPSKPVPRPAGLRFVPVEITAGPSIEVHLQSGARVVVRGHHPEVIRTVIAAASQLHEAQPC
jgi:transposase-like protein